MVAFLGILCTLLLTVAVDSQTFSVLPDALWVSNGGTHNIVEGHVIQLYCSANDITAPTIRWEKGGTEIFQDPPHIFIRTTVSGVMTSSVLTIDPFNSTDDGWYQCIVSTGSTSISSGLLTLTTVSSSGSTSLTISRQPADNEQNSRNTLTAFDIIANSRTGVRVTDVDPAGTNDANQLMRCVASHVGGAGAVSTPPTLVWTRNGEEVVHDGTHISITDTLQGDQLESNLQINSFTDNDAGIYQCIYTDTDSDAEVATSLPHRLDYGDVLRLSSITPQLIIIEPPEKLVIEVQSSGAYDVILWRRNGASYTFNDPDFPISSDRFFYFYEAYVREPTSTDDLGLYEVYVLNAGGQDTSLAPDQFFTVVHYVAPITITQTPTQTVMEGRSLTLTCISGGIPPPTFTWRLNGEDIPKNRHTDTSTDPVVDFDRLAGAVTSVTNGMTTSVLTISGAVFPGDDGLYECIGTNSRAGMDNSSNAFIQLSVQVEPEVEITATPQARIALGQSDSLFCNVTRANPNVNFTYVWRMVSGPTLPDETNTLVLSNIKANQFGTYSCEVTNNAGSRSGTLSIEQGFLPSVSVDKPAPVILGTSVVMNCSASGDTPISYVWEQVGQRGVVLSTEESFTLTVTDVSQYGIYRCTAINILGSDSGTVEVLQAFAPASMAVTADPDRILYTGEVVTLTCDITLDPAVYTEVAVTASWTGPGGPITAGVVDMTDAAPYQSTLTLSSLMTSDAGDYTCTASVDPEPAATFLSAIENATGIQTITIERYIVGIAATGVAATSETYSLTCTVEGVTDSPAIQWFGPNRIEVAAGVSTGHFTSTLTLSNLSLADAGEYKCQSTLSGVVRMAVQLVLVENEAIFQLQLGPVAQCTSWTDDKTSAFEAAISETVSKVISERCSCNFSATALQSGLFSCWSSPSEVTYRSTIVSTDNTSRLVGYIDDWVMSEQKFTQVRKFRLKVYQDCPVRISSLNDPECSRVERPSGGPSVIASSDPVIIGCLNLCLLRVRGETLCASP